MRFHQMAARLVLGLLIMHPFLLVTQRPGCCNFAVPIAIYRDRLPEGSQP